MTPFDAYTKYLALKNHFTSDYDYFQYGGKVSARQDAFERRRDKYQFYKLSKKKDVEGFLIANFIDDNSNKWIGDLNDKESEDVYNKWKGRQESITYLYKNDLNKMDDDLDLNLKVIDGQYPKLLQLYQFGTVSIETLVVLNKVVNYIPHWTKNITDHIIWPEHRRRILKYEPFVKFDPFKMKKLTLERFTA
jgi:hypothetical protein